MRESAVDVTVIVPVRDDPAGLRRCLAALAAQRFRGHFEVVVADNGSAEPVADIVAPFPFARSVEQPTGGSYAARNKAMESARAPILAFTDSDCVPSPVWLQRGVAAVAEASVGLVAGRIDIFVRDPDHPRAAELYDVVHAFPQARYVEEHHFGATANVFTRRDVVDTVGPFDAGLTSGGDKEWGARVHAAGYAVCYCADVVVAHPARRSWREHHRKLRRVHEGDRQLGHPGRARSLPARLVFPVGTIARGWVDGRLGGARSRTKYAVAVVIHRYLSTWVAHRSRTRSRHALNPPTSMRG